MFWSKKETEPSIPPTLAGRAPEPRWVYVGENWEAAIEHRRSPLRSEADLPWLCELKVRAVADFPTPSDSGVGFEINRINMPLTVTFRAGTPEAAKSVMAECARKLADVLSEFSEKVKNDGGTKQ